MTAKMAAKTYGKLIIMGKDGSSGLEFPLDKKTTLIGRDPSCDIRLLNKEISRKHAEIYVEDNGVVLLNSIGREPVSVNGAPVTSPLQLNTGDKLEVHLEGRTRIFYFHGLADDTVQVSSRAPLSQLNSTTVPAVTKTSRSSKKPKHPAADEDQQGNNGDGPNDMQGAPNQNLPLSGPGEVTMAVSSMVQQVITNAIGKAIEEANTKAGPGEVTMAVSELVKKAFENVGDAVDEDHGPSDTGMKEEADGPASPVRAGDVTVAVAEMVKQAFANAVTASAQEHHDTPVDENDSLQPADSYAHPGEVTLTVSELVKEAFSVAVTAAEELDRLQPAMSAPVEPTLDISALVKDALEKALAAAEDADANVVVEHHDEEMCPVGEVTMAVSDLVKRAFDSALAASDAKAPVTATKVRKSVRFTTNAAPEGTPEGAAADATISMHLRPGGAGEQAILVEDDTMAFAQWAQGTMPADHDDAVIPDTVVSKKGRRDSFVAPLEGSNRKLSLTTASAGGGLTPRAAPLSATKKSVKMTPARIGLTPTAPGVKAPACTPATLLKSSSIHAAGGDALAQEMNMDPTVLMARLTELAEEHDITFELPSGFMQWTPGNDAAGLPRKKTIGITLTPRVAPHMASAAKMPRSAQHPTTEKRSRLAHAASEAAEAPRPVGSAGVVVMERLTAALEAVASARKDDVHSTPGSVARRRASLRTPGTKIAIIARGTPRAGGAPSSVKKPAGSTPLCVSHGYQLSRYVAAEAQVYGPEDSPIDLVESERQKRDGVVVVVEGGARDDAPPPTVKQNESNSSDGARVVVAMAMDGVDDAEKMDESNGQGNERMQSHDDDVRGRPERMVPVAEYHRAMLRAKTYRQESARLYRQLQTVTARALRLKRVATSLAGALSKEKARRVELQDALQAIAAGADASEEEEDMMVDVQNRAYEEEQVVARNMVVMDVDDVEEDDDHGEGVVAAAVAHAQDAPPCLQAQQQSPGSNHPKQQHQQVVVVGYRPKPVHTTVQRAGCVIVVRPPAPRTSENEGKPVVSAMKTKSASKASKTPGTAARSSGARPAKTPVTSGKNPSRSLKKRAPGEGVVVGAVEVPAWVFESKDDDEEEEAEQRHLQAELQEVEAAEKQEKERGLLSALVDGVELHADVQEGQDDDVMASEEQHLEAAEHEEDGEEDDADDVCYVCHGGEEGDVLLLCDGCEHACHLACCDPPLKRVPKGDWYCAPCVDAKKQRAGAGKKSGGAKGVGRKRPAEDEPIEEEERASSGLKKKTKGSSAVGKRSTRGGGKGAAAAKEEPPTKRSTRSRR